MGCWMSLARLISVCISVFLITQAAAAKTVVLKGDDALFLTRQISNLGIVPDANNAYVIGQVICQRGMVVYNDLDKVLFKAVMRLRKMRDQASNFACYLGGEKNPLQAFVDDPQNLGFVNMKASVNGELPLVLKDSLSDVAVSRVACAYTFRKPYHSFLIQVDAKLSARCSLDILD